MVNSKHVYDELLLASAGRGSSSGRVNCRSINENREAAALEQELLTLEVDLLFENPPRPGEEDSAILRGRRSRSYLQGSRTHRTSRLHRRMLFRATDELTLRTGLVRLEDADQRFLALIKDEGR